MKVPAETRELAYRVWRECQQNLSETVRVMNNEHGYVVTRQSVAEWRDRFDWQGRAARTDAEAEKLDQATASEALLNVLLKQKGKYEDYLDSLPIGEVDNQAIYAFNNILKTIVDIRTKTDATVEIDRPKLFLEDLEFIAETLRDVDPEGLKVLGRSFDLVVKRFKEAHAQAA